MDKPAYTIAEISIATGFSRQTITRLFEGESEVLILNKPKQMHKRQYRSLRIPRHVYERVLAKLSKR